MKVVEKIEMIWPDDWAPSNVLSSFVGRENVYIRDLKRAMRNFMRLHGMSGTYYFRLRRAGRAWRYFTVCR